MYGPAAKKDEPTAHEMRGTEILRGIPPQTALVLAAQAGDQTAFETLVNVYQRELLVRESAHDSRRASRVGHSFRSPGRTLLSDRLFDRVWGRAMGIPATIGARP